MKVRISFNIIVGDETRRALTWRYFIDKGDTDPRTMKLASRKDIKEWYEQHGVVCDIDLSDEYHRAIERWKEKNES